MKTLWMKGHPGSVINRLSVAACASLVVLSVWSASTASGRTLSGHVPAAVKDLRPVGRLPANQQLDLAIGLPLRNREALTNLLRELYDPTSPSYRHFLVPKQFADRFGPTEQDYQQVISFAKANGLSVVGMHSNRLVLDVHGSVANIENTFHVNLRNYQHPKENRT